MKRLVLILAVVFLVLSPGLVRSGAGHAGTTYYVNTAADAGGDGTTTDLTGAHCAFATIAQVNAASFSADDQILFTDGCVWRATLTPPGSGSAGHPIVFSRTGGGAKPQILGSTALSSWSQTDIPAPSADILAESFEGAGYESSWTEVLGSGSVIDEDSTDVARPTGGGDQVLKIQKVSPNFNALIRYSTGSDLAVVYAVFDVRIAAHNLSSVGDDICLGMGLDSSWVAGWKVWLRKTATGVHFMFRVRSGGTYIYASSADISLDTWYKIKIKYDTTNHAYAFLVDDTSIGAGSLTDAHAAGTYYVAVGSAEDDNTMTAYFDMVRVSSTGYPVPTTALPANCWKAACAAQATEAWILGSGSTVYWTDKKTGAMSDCVNEFDWFWDNRGYFILYSATDPGTAYSGVEAASRNNGVYADQSYITISGLDVRYCNQFGIQTGGADKTGWVISGNDVHYAGAKNSAYADCVAVRCGGTTVSDNAISNSGSHGVYVVCNGDGDTVDGVVVSGNTISDCYHTGIDVMCIHGTLTNTSVVRNTYRCTAAYDTAYTSRGIFVSGDTAGHEVNGVLVAYNLIISYYNVGIQIGGADGIEKNITCDNNTVYEHLAGVSTATWAAILNGTMSTTDSTNSFRNNILAQSNDHASSIVLSFQTSADVANLDNNLYYRIGGAGSANTIDVDGTGYTSQATYRAALAPKEAASRIAVDPLIVGSGDYSLQAASPCRNAGASLGYLTDIAGTAIGLVPDMGAYEYPAGVPTLAATDAASAIAATTATSGGNVTDAGDATITARGVCWRTSTGPVATDSHTTDAGTTGAFTSSLTSLSATTKYYVRAYATNSAGTGYGAEINFTTLTALVVSIVIW